METYNVFLSKDNKRVILTVDGAPSFTRGCHEKLLKEQGFNLNDLDNVTCDFYYTGKGQSIRQFLN